MMTRCCALLRNPKLLWLALGLSLMLNIFGAAAMTGFVMGGRLPMLILAGAQVETALGNLPEAKRTALRAQLRNDVLPSLRSGLQQSLQTRTAILALLRKPDLKEGEIAAIFADWQTQTAHMQQGLQQKLLPIIMALTPAERAALADGLEQALQRLRKTDSGLP